jgi:hypothetical protein
LKNKIVCFGLLRTAALAAALALIAVVPSPAAEGGGRFFLTIRGGLFRPGDAQVRALYGTSAWPLTIQAGVRLWGPLSVFGGYRSLGMKGATVVVGPSFEADREALQWSDSSWRAGLQFQAAAGAWIFRAYGGAVFLSYKETWPDAAIVKSGKSRGFLAGVGIDFRIFRGLALTAAVEYDREAATGAGRLTTAPKLGGIEAGLGLTLRF